MPTQRLLHRFTYGAVAAGVAVLLPMAVHAQDPGGTFPIDSTYQTISNYTLVIANFLNVMTWFVFSFLVYLLDPRFIFDMTSGGASGSLMDVLNEVWQLSRNLMNIAFALGLVGAAIYTVVTANKEFVSANLKTFVMAVVLVNFSWFIPRVVLDIANISTVTVYSIPSAIVNTSAQCRYTSTSTKFCFGQQGPDANGTYTCACKAVAEFKPFPDDATRRTLGAMPATWDCNLAYCVRYVELDPANSTKHGTIINGLVVNHARLSQLAVVTRTKSSSTISDLLLFVLRQMIVVVIHVALFFPLLALLVALILRIPILWLTMAFMPFYFLSWIVPDGVPFLGEMKENAKKIWEWFLKAAFLPAVVAVPLAVGFIMANAGTRVDFAGMNKIPFNLIDGMGSFAQLLWVLMVLAILWSGTFAALELMMGDMPGGSIIGQIKNTGEQAGKFAAELPLAAAPIPGASGAGSLLNVKDMLNPGALRQAIRGKDGIKGLADMFNEKGRTKTQSANAAATVAKDANKERDLKKALDDFTARSTSANFDALRRQLQDLGVSNVERGNIDTVVSDIHTTLEREHNKPLFRRDELDKFNQAVDRMRGPTTPPPAPAPGGPPPVNPAP